MNKQNKTCLDMIRLRYNSSSVVPIINIFIIIKLLIIVVPVSAQQPDKILEGVVRSSYDNSLIAGASVVKEDEEGGTVTDRDGKFKLPIRRDEGILIVTSIGFERKEMAYKDPADLLEIVIDPIENTLDQVEVVSTGYNAMPRERATGAFEVINKNVLNQSFSSNMLERLEGTTGAIAFDRRTANLTEDPNARLNLRLRGLSTIMSDAEPLIIVNNFPFEGELADINPNDIESIVLLKDAASSAIWGAKSGNGVLVIQLKEAAINEKGSINFTWSNRIGERPNLMDNRRFLSSSDFIGLERNLFERGYYQEAPTIVQSPVVHMLFQQQRGEILTDELEGKLEALEKNDIRIEAADHLYRPSFTSGLNFSMRQSNAKHAYMASLGYDKQNTFSVGQNERRLTLRVDNSVQISPRMDAKVALDYVHRNKEDNGVSMFSQSGIVPGGRTSIYPYASLFASDGSEIGIAKDLSYTYLENFQQETGRDWMFRPLQELALRNNFAASTGIRIFSSMGYKILENLRFSALYNYNFSGTNMINTYAQESYFARNIINRFIKSDGTAVVPEGSIRHYSPNNQRRHALRAQIDYNDTFYDKLSVNGLLGSEVSQLTEIYEPTHIVYGFDEDTYVGNGVLDFLTFFPVRPQGSQRIPSSGANVSQLRDRFVSYYGLASLDWDQKYILSGSLRWDASNLFGVKTNQKGVPLWSVGTSWLISNESYMEDLPFSLLKLRATIGENGNVNKNATAYPTGGFATNTITRLPEALLRTAGNPQLKWERVKSYNLGLDFGIYSNKIKGSVEWYQKNSYDLIGYRNADPTTGLNPTTTGVRELVNYGRFLTKGIDITLGGQTEILPSLHWSADLRISRSSNRVLDYEVTPLTIDEYFQYTVPAVADRSRDVMYAFPWFGLDAESGSPLIMNDGQLGTTYGTYVSNFDTDHLLQVGNAVPIWNGTFRNSFSFKNFSASVLLLWKGAYAFRRPSIDYALLFESWGMHEDYMDRWKSSGDENHTSIPSLPETLDRNRESYYRNSEILIEDGDHIRLQNINLGYRLDLKSTKIKVDIQLIAENLGIIWRKNRSGLDPDYFMNYYQPPRNFSLGLRTQF